MTLVPDWKEAYKWFSVHGAVAMVVLGTVYSVWPAFQYILPGWLFGLLSAALGVAIIVGRLIQQGVIKEPS